MERKRGKGGDISMPKNLISDTKLYSILYSTDAL